MDDLVRLLCILIDDDLKVHDFPFTIKVPIREEVGGIIRYVKEVTPSLRDKDHGKFRFYKPPLNHPIHVSDPHPGFQLTTEHLRSPLLILGNVLVLEDRTFREYFTDSDPQDSSGSEMRCVTAIEALHYANTLINHHLSDQEAYREKAVSHIYSLLRRFTTDPPSPHGISDVTWSLRLVMARETDQTLCQYTPHSDFFMSIGGFLHVLLEICSDKVKKRDQHRMLLQASCLVRLGNKLITDKSPFESSTFFVKAIYIDHNYNAIEYTLYQKGSEPGNDKVEYCMTRYKLTNRHDMFTLIFRIYNLLPSIRALHARLPPQLSEILLSTLTETKGFPYATGQGKHSTEDSLGGHSKQRNQQSSPSSATGTTKGTTL
ncbi:hypothetical protein H4582DRAFT_2052659 [Lactarius indigo]|nr:hypothetical protein H4582DRAFT_2052653 [Lactarius indigo]KAI9446722.1 hypothetical protein H4582DRAFT_2052659 [Lactarius indigo]